jgi:hypothetical protein
MPQTIADNSRTMTMMRAMTKFRRRARERERRLGHAVDRSFRAGRGTSAGLLLLVEITHGRSDNGGRPRQRLRVVRARARARVCLYESASGRRCRSSVPVLPRTRVSLLFSRPLSFRALLTRALTAHSLTLMHDVCTHARTHAWTTHGRTSARCTHARTHARNATHRSLLRFSFLLLPRPRTRLFRSPFL